MVRTEMLPAGRFTNSLILTMYASMNTVTFDWPFPKTAMYSLVRFVVYVPGTGIDAVSSAVPTDAISFIPVARRVPVDCPLLA